MLKLQEQLPVSRQVFAYLWQPNQSKPYPWGGQDPCWLLAELMQKPHKGKAPT